MSVIDDFMSKVIDLNETEKEEVIILLANALIRGEPKLVAKSVSMKVMATVLPFMTDAVMEEISVRMKKGGEIKEWV